MTEVQRRAAEHRAPIHLTRIDPTRNMARFYRLDVQPDLFGGVRLVREWGRIGQAGRISCETFPEPDAAEAAMQRTAASKRRRGYL